MAWCDLRPGQALDGGAYAVASIDDRGIWIRRRSGSLVRVTRGKVARTRRRLLSGDLLERQAPERAGGISYTSAVARAVVAALADVCVYDDVLGVYRRRSA